MGLIADLKQSSRLGIWVAVAAATVGVIYGYDSSNVAGALLFMTKDLGLSVDQQQLITTAVVVGEVAGALFGTRWLPHRPQALDGAGRRHLRGLLPAVRAGLERAVADGCGSCSA